MKDAVNIEIYRTSYNKINRIKKWVNIKQRLSSNKKQVIEYILTEFIKSKDLDYLFEDKFSQTVKGYKTMLKDYRSDIHLDFHLKEDIEAIQDHLEHRLGRKVSVNNIVKTAISEYIDNHPEIKFEAERHEYIKLKVMSDEKFGINK